MEINTREILRYSGFRGAFPDPKTAEMIEELKKEVELCSDPKSIYKEVEFTKTEESITVENMTFHSKKLVSHLKNSDRLLIFAATLGTPSDIMLRKYISSNSAKAVLAQATLAAACESYCDEVCSQIAKKELENGYYLRPRFSPGYADLDLTSQRELFALLDITKRIGVYLSDNCLMIPTKSVSAFIGLTRDKDCNINSCENCGNTECEFRRT